MLVLKVSKEILEDLSFGVLQLSDDEYSMPLELLSGHSIGQHTRHILEFYTCFLEGSVSGEIDYDQRERNLKLETDIKTAIKTIDEIKEKLTSVTDESILLKYTNQDNSQLISTSIERELLYNIEHSIHHMAIIKIAIKSCFHQIELSANFGVAPSTIAYQNSLNVHR